jgi:hypothetical protein
VPATGERVDDVVDDLFVACLVLEACAADLSHSARCLWIGVARVRKTCGVQAKDRVRRPGACRVGR